MSIKIPIETSARHLHISQEDFEKLFGEGSRPHFIRELSQPGQYLCQERVTVKGPKGVFQNMALLGPFRKETQVELSLTDVRKLGIPGVIRQSGDIENTPGCILSGPCGDIEIPKGVIVAKRHIHMPPEDALALHIKDNDEVFVLTKSYGRALIYADVVVRHESNISFHKNKQVDDVICIIRKSGHSEVSERDISEKMAGFLF